MNDWYVSNGEWFDKNTVVLLLKDHRPYIPDSGLFYGFRSGEVDEEICHFDEFQPLNEYIENFSYKDRFGDSVKVNQIYKCKKCGWTGKATDMRWDTDCDDPYDAIYSDYCCPECWEFYSYITDWEKVENG